jgi:hypothetical protein
MCLLAAAWAESAAPRSRVSRTDVAAVVSGMERVAARYAARTGAAGDGDERVGGAGSGEGRENARVRTAARPRRAFSRALSVMELGITREASRIFSPLGGVLVSRRR